MNINTGINGKRILLLGSCGVLGRAHVQILVDQKASLIIADRPGSSVLNDAEALGVQELR